MTIPSIAPLEPRQLSTAAANAVSTAQDSTSASGDDSTVDNVSENEFLQLLVAQIQYQDPTNPTDSTTFVTQLAQFSSLEQLIGIHNDLNGLTTAGSPQNTNSTQGGN